VFCGVCSQLITSTASAVILNLSTNQIGWADQGFIDAIILPDLPDGRVRISILYDKKRDSMIGVGWVFLKNRGFG
jgi:hypothetical protein